MKRIRWVLPLLATGGCGDREGRQLEPLVREAVGWPSREGDGSASPDRALGIIWPPPNSWVSTDPFALQVTPETGEMQIAGRGGARGGSGVVARWQGGRFRVVWRVRCERMDWATGVDVGLFLLGGLRGQDPAVCVHLGASGGEGDLRHLALLQADGGEPSASHETIFPTAQDFDIVLWVTSDGAAVEFRLPHRKDPVARWQTQIRLPHGLYVLGVGPRDGDAGVVAATVTLVELAGDIEPVPHSSADVPRALRGALGGAGDDDVIGRVASMLVEPVADWDTTSAEVRRWIYLALSLGIEQPGLYSWHERVAIRRAGVRERQGRMLPLMVAEIGQTLRLVAPHDDRRRDLMDWVAPALDLDPVPVRLAAVRIHEFLAQPEPRSTEPLVAAFRYLQCDFAAGLLWEHLDSDDPAFAELIEYASSPEADAWLARALAFRVAKTDSLTARRLCQRALDDWICDVKLHTLLRELADTDLLARWTSRRANAPAILRAALTRQRRMGMGAAAARTAHALLGIDESPASLRLSAAVFCLARDRKGVAMIRALIADPDLGAVLRQALREDPFLVVHRRKELEDLGAL